MDTNHHKQKLDVAHSNATSIKDNQVDDDQISYCGSFGGESYLSTRRRRACTLRQHQSELLSRKLRAAKSSEPSAQHEHSVAAKHNPLTLSDKQLCIVPADDAQDDSSVGSSGCGRRARVNSVFHNYRFIVVMLGGISTGIMVTLRYNITVAILNMVNQTAVYLREHPNSTLDDFHATGMSAGGEFDWDNQIQQMVMSWYMAAYTLPQFPLTKLGLMVGTRYAVPGALFVCALATLLTPWAAYISWKCVIVLRLVNGLGATCVLPLMINLVESWMPYDEISLGLTFANTFHAILMCLNPLLAGLLSAIHWKYAFYVPAWFTIFFCIAWLILVSDKPEQNWLISEHELHLICGCPEDKAIESAAKEKEKKQKNYIETKITMPRDEQEEQQQQQQQEEPYKAVWTDIFRLPLFYVYMFLWCFYCSTYGGFFFVLPAYLRQFLHLPVEVNGFYCSLIQSGFILSIIWPHPVLRLLRNKFGMSETNSRRVVGVGLCAMVSLTWIYVGLFHDNQLVMLFINRCFHGSNDIVVTGTLMANFAEVGLSSVVFSILNSIGNLTVVGTSTFIGRMLDYTANSDLCWSFIMCGLGVAQIIMMAVFTTIHHEPVKFKPRKSGAAKNTQQHTDKQVRV